MHGVLTRYTIHLASKHSDGNTGQLNHPGIFWIPFIVILIFITTVIEAVIWAVTYLGIGAFEILDDALYFSIVTFTTLGFGDITLSEEWRLLSSFEAANGIIIFGWSTAIFMAVVQRIYFPK